MTHGHRHRKHLPVYASTRSKQESMCLYSDLALINGLLGWRIGITIDGVWQTNPKGVKDCFYNHFNERFKADTDINWNQDY
ncbi:hypothetical protein LXL04_008554 [Taraxacum kok-saghyz]